MVAALACTLLLAGHSPTLPLAVAEGAEAPGFDPIAAVEPLRHPVVDAGPGVLQVSDARYRGEFTAEGFALMLRDDSSFERESAFALETMSFAGERVAGVDWRPEANTVERDVAPGVTERVTARDGSLEWDFVLAHRPAVAGDLHIEAGVEARGPPTRVGNEWAWPAGSDRSVMMGELVVLDANGDELYRALPDARGRRVLLTVPGSVLSEARYPLTIDPVISAEYPASDPFAGVAAPGSQGNSAVGFDGSNFLVIWTDWRKHAEADVFAARVSPAGVVLDPAGIPISTAIEYQRSPEVAFDGMNFLVVWIDGREGGDDIYGTRVSQAGTVLDPSGIVISDADDDQWNPRVASDGARFLVAWEDWRSGGEPDIYGTGVSSAGTVLSPTGTPISTAADWQRWPVVAASGTGFLVAWEDWRNSDEGIQVFGTPVSSTGVVANPTGAKYSGTDFATDPAIAFNGTNHLVTWSAADEAFDGGTRGARVSPAGAVLDPTGITISIDGLHQSFSSVASNGTDFFVVWDDFRSGDGSDVYGTGVTAAGTVSTPGGALLVGTNPVESRPAISFGAGSYLLTWNWGDFDFDSDIRAARVTQAGVVGVAPFVASQSISNQENAAVGFDGTNYLAVWEEPRADGYDIVAARVTPGGTKLDGTGFVVSAAPDNQRNPSVAFDGTNYLVVWDDAENVYGARVSPAGSVLDLSGIAISTAAGAQSDPSVAFDGTNAVVVWTDTRLEGDSSDIFGSRVAPNGIVLEPAGIPISTTEGDQMEPRLASSGTNVLVAWSDSGTDNVIGARLSSAGALLDPAGISISAAPNWQRTPSLAFDGTNYVVVWEDFRSDDTWDVYGARVSTAGSVLEPAGIPISKDIFAGESAPTVAFDGTNSVVAWRDERAGYELWDIYAARVSTAGVVHDPLGFGVATSSSQETVPVAVRGASGTVGVVYDRLAMEAPFGGLDRAVLRVLNTLPGTPAAPSIDSGPSGPVSSTSATFEFSGGPGGTFECRIDAAAFSACSSPKSYTGLSQGSRTFEVRANDAGTVGPARSRTWTIDTVPPPIPVLTGGPAPVSAQPNPTFQFTDTESGVVFECSLDSTVTFSACTSPKQYTGVAAGSHTFRVRAKDALGNTSSSAVQMWTIDLTPPPTPTIDSGPSGTVASTSATFTFSDTEPNVTYQCELDNPPSPTTCTSGQTFTSLAEGAHTFRVRAMDAAGNTGNFTATRSWTVDTVAPPIPTITSGPTGTVAATGGTFTFSTTESGAAYQCRLDTAPFAACTSPVPFANLAQGPHSFEVRARDAFGNVSLAASRAWSVDTVAPQTVIGTKPKPKTTARTAKFTFKSEKGAKFECKLDKAGWKACKSPVTYKKLKPGKHTFQVRAKDAVGNVDKSPAKFSWRVT